MEGVFNKRYKMIKKLGEGAQGTVFVVEDLQDNNKKYFASIYYGSYFLTQSNKSVS